MYTYFAYGLGIRSALPLPELQPLLAEVEADVVIRLGELASSLPETIRTGSQFHTTAEEAYFSWNQVATCLVRGGKEIIIDPVPSVEERRLRMLLLGAAMGVLLHQRRLLVLHASAVTLNDRSIIFLGKKGWGKSTMAATLHGRGHSFMSDDVVALDMDNSRSPKVFPAFPQLKLWPDAVASLGNDPNAFPRLNPQFEKRDCRISCGFLQKSTPLKHIYVLAKGSSLEIEPLQHQDGMMQLISNLYVMQFSREWQQGIGIPSYFLQCAELVKNVPIYRLSRPSSLALLPTIADMVEEHVARDIHLATV